jgi:hypothetical protein
MVPSFVIRLSMQRRHAMRQNPPPYLTEFARHKNLNRAALHRKWLTHTLRLGYLLTHPESFYH